MATTIDQFPGTRFEEAIVFESGSNLPLNSGEMIYASGSISGSGFFFNEEGKIKGLGIDVPTHEALNTFTHDPPLGFTSASYNTIGITYLALFTDNLKTTLLQDYVVHYGFNRLISNVTASLYVTGSLSYQIVEEPTYDTRRRITLINRTSQVF